MNQFKACLILLISTLGCKTIEVKEASPTFREAFFADEKELKPFVSVDFSREKMRLLPSTWEFLGRDSVAGIASELKAFETQELLELPHRIQAPNQNFWYRKKLMIEPGVLWINADDGAQLWIDGRRVPRSKEGAYFEVQDSGTVEMTIRVINNAMAGGLRAVHWMNRENFELERKRIAEERDSLFLLRKVALVQNDNFNSKLSSASPDQQREWLADYPILLTDPVVIQGSDGKPYLRWISEVGGKARLEFAEGEVMEVASTDGVFTLSASGLSNRDYQLSQDKSSFGTFTVPAEIPAERVRLAVWGDSQGGWDTFRSLASQIAAMKVDLSVGAGDLVNNGSEKYAYLRFLQALSLMKTRQLPVPGNHDYDGFYEDLDPLEMNNFLFQPKSPTYGVHWAGPAAILTLDPNVNFPVGIPEASPQRIFLEKTLASEDWKAAKWRIVVLHQPPFSQGWPGYHGEQSILKLLNSYFHEGLIDLVIAGHTHDYERLRKDFSGNSVTFLVVGGAGGGLEPPRVKTEYPQMDLVIKAHHFAILDLDYNTMNWKVFGINGEQLDQLILEKKGSL